MFLYRWQNTVGRSTLVLILLVGLFGFIPSSVQAATVIVTNTNDSGVGSLRQAILNASSGDTILFDASLAGQTIALSSQIVLDKNLVIDGSSVQPRVAISGSLSTRIFSISGGSAVTLKYLVLRDGRGNTGAGGGAILNNGDLTISDSTFSNNSTTGNGGAIYDDHYLVLNNSTFSNNSAANGGAVYLYHQGIFTNNIPASIVNSTFVSNQADLVNGSGGGIYSAFPGNLMDSGLVLTNNTLSGNGAHTGGNLLFDGNLTAINNIFANSAAGGDCYSMGIITLSNVSGTNNLIEDGGYCFQGPYVTGDPLLGPLSDNGGPTLTMALLPGSPAIDGGTTVCVSTDQRGVARPQGAACEIGAYEYEYQTVVRRVKWNASGANNGTSWTDAYTSLQSALAAAVTGDEIWVAAGTYEPTAGTDRAVSFALKNGVALYGGFAGTETLRSQRNFGVNVTTLSGDIGVAGNTGDNSYHVVVGSNTRAIAKLDGFTITGGNADGAPTSPLYPSSGGGMLNVAGSPNVENVIFNANSAIFGGGMSNIGESIFKGSNPVLKNVVFSGNSATEGGGMRNENYSNPSLNQVRFSNNTAIRSSGGMENYLYSNPTLMDVIFEGNTGGVGPGGLGNFNSSPVLTNVTFNGNSATVNGGGIVNAYGSPSFTNVTLVGNTAPYGGGMWNSSSLPVLTNVTFKNNSASTYGGGIYSEVSTTLTARNTILWGNIAPAGAQIYADANSISTVSDSVVQGGLAGGTNIITADPLLGSLGDFGGFTQTIPLQNGSSAIDTGNDSICPSTDQRGVTRPQGSHCDMGAYEYVAVATPTHTSTPTATPAITTLVLQPDAAAGIDTFINSAAGTSNYGTANVMGVGEDNSASNRVTRSLLKFNLGPIPANAVIQSALLSLWTSSDMSNNARTINVYRLKVPFNETQATWNVSATGINWQQAGASGANDRETTAIGSVSIANNEPLNAEKQIALNASKVQEWVNGGFANQGMILVANTEVDDLFSYKTSDSATSAQRPKLVIQYSIPAGTATNTPSAIATNTFTHTPTRTPTFTVTVNTQTFTPTRTPTPTPTRTPTQSVSTSTFTPTRTPTATFTATSTSSFPITSILDGFNRSNGAIGSSWSGYNTSAFTIAFNQLSVTSAGESYAYWSATSQGADQEAYFTFVQVYPNSSQQSLLMKLRNDGSGTIKVVYNAGTDVVQVLTYHPSQGWVQRGADIPVVFVNGDHFGARARADGTVEVYKNGTPLASRSITAWPYYADGGYIGIGVSNVSGTIIDNFGGGTR